MSDEKLAAFRAGDRQKKRVGAAAKPSAQEEAHATMGFARIEHILDEVGADAAAARLRGLVDALTAREEGAKSARERGACRRARGAMERTMDLLDHLFATKQAMADGAGAPAGATR